jgi:signal transduction histidine kinase
MAAIGEMASMVAHGIRNPLASVRSSAELIALHDLDGARGAARDIVGSVDRLNEWIRNFLYHAHGDMREWASIDCNTVIRGCLSDWTRAMQRQGVGLTVNLEEELPQVSGHPVILGHALSSLLANALEAMPHGGKLEVSTSATDDGRTVEIRIADSGHGISKDIAERLFHPSSTTKSAGLGLGLALSRRVFERSGGGLELTTIHSGGALAIVRLPAAT